MRASLSSKKVLVGVAVTGNTGTKELVKNTETLSLSTLELFWSGMCKLRGQQVWKKKRQNCIEK